MIFSKPWDFVVNLYDPKKTSWWFQPSWKILDKLDHFPRDRGENKTCLKPPARKAGNCRNRSDSDLTLKKNIIIFPTEPCKEWPTGMLRSMCSTFPGRKTPRHRTPKTAIPRSNANYERNPGWKKPVGKGCSGCVPVRCVETTLERTRRKSLELGCGPQQWPQWPPGWHETFWGDRGILYTCICHCYWEGATSKV